MNNIEKKYNELYDKYIELKRSIADDVYKRLTSKDESFEINESHLKNYIVTYKGYKFILHFLNNDCEHEILIMEQSGKAFAKLYWYDDDKEVVYLSSLSVNEDMRGIGIGTILQEIREDIGKGLNATKSMLWVVKDSWMKSWYERRGYIYTLDHETEENNIWMEKQL